MNAASFADIELTEAEIAAGLEAGVAQGVFSSNDIAETLTQDQPNPPQNDAGADASVEIQPRPPNNPPTPAAANVGNSEDEGDDARSFGYYLDSPEDYAMETLRLLETTG